VNGFLEVRTMLTGFSVARQQVTSALEALSRLAAECEIKQAHAAVSDALHRLSENRFNLVVFGEFKRGKSTFLNSLLGRDVLPTAVIPLTSIVTIVQYGEQERAVVRFLHGEQRTVSLEEIEDYITETANPENRKGVARVEVFLPAPLLRDGVRLVDTPGVGSVYEHNTQVAQEFLPHADAAVFLVAADPPISKTEREFLRLVRDYAVKLFVVQNKIDNLTAEELNQSLQFTRSVIAQEIGEDLLRIYPLSARQALTAKLCGDEKMLEESGLPAFERDLDDFLTHERGNVALLSAMNTALLTASAIRSSIDLETRAVQMPLEDLEQRLSEFQRRLATLRKQREQHLFLLKRLVHQQVLEQLDAHLTAMQSVNHRPLYEKLASVCRDGRASPLKLIEELNRLMPKWVEETITSWQQQEVERISATLNEKLQPFTDEVNAFIEQVQRLSEDIFDVRWQTLAHETALADWSRFYVRVWEVRVKFDFTIMPMLMLLPRRWVCEWIQRAAWHRLWEQFHIHCGQARYDFARRIEETIGEYMRALDSRVEETAQAIESVVRQAVQAKAEGEASANAVLARLHEQQQQVASLTEEMHRLRENLSSPFAQEAYVS
jgi:small GTP-binding protein